MANTKSVPIYCFPSPGMHLFQVASPSCFPDPGKQLPQVASPTRGSTFPSSFHGSGKYLGKQLKGAVLVSTPNPGKQLSKELPQVGEVVSWRCFPELLPRPGEAFFEIVECMSPFTMQRRMYRRCVSVVCGHMYGFQNMLWSSYVPVYGLQM